MTIRHNTSESGDWLAAFGDKDQNETSDSNRSRSGLEGDPTPREGPAVPPTPPGPPGRRLAGRERRFSASNARASGLRSLMRSAAPCKSPTHQVESGWVPEGSVPFI